MDKKVIEKQERLDLIFGLIQRLPACADKDKMLQEIQDVFMRIENYAEGYHKRNHLIQERSAEKMVCPPELILSKDCPDQSFMEQKNHILVVSAAGAFAVYGLIDTKVAATSSYADCDPIYQKPSASGFDVFGLRLAS